MASRFKFARNFSVTWQREGNLQIGTEILNPCIGSNRLEVVSISSSPFRDVSATGLTPRWLDPGTFDPSREENLSTHCKLSWPAVCIPPSASSLWCFCSVDHNDF